MSSFPNSNSDSFEQARSNYNQAASTVRSVSIGIIVVAVLVPLVSLVVIGIGICYFCRRRRNFAEQRQQQQAAYPTYAYSNHPTQPTQQAQPWSGAPPRKQDAAWPAQTGYFEQQQQQQYGQGGPAPPVYQPA